MVTSNPSLQSDAIVQERVRQARKSFDLAYAMTATSALIGLAGAILLVFKHVPAGVVATSGGTSLSICCLRLAKDANDRLDKLISELDDNNPSS